MNEKHGTPTTAMLSMLSPVWLLALSACTAASTKNEGGAAERYGLAPSNPIEVCLPTGQRAYLSALICPSGEPVAFHRTGNAGPRDPHAAEPSVGEMEALLRGLRRGHVEPLPPGRGDDHRVDAYAVRCGDSSRTVYLDMYHCPDRPPTQAPDGFRLRPP